MSGKGSGIGYYRMLCVLFGGWKLGNGWMVEIAKPGPWGQEHIPVGLGKGCWPPCRARSDNGGVHA